MSMYKMKLLFLAFFVFTFSALAGDKTKIYSLENVDAKAINFKFDETRDVYLERGQFFGDSGDLNHKSYKSKTKPLHTNKSSREFFNERKKLKKENRELHSLGLWYSIPITSEMSEQEILDIFNDLVENPAISHVEFEVPVIDFDSDCTAPKCSFSRQKNDVSLTSATPDFQYLQGYLDASPGGVDALYGWAQNGGNGAGVKIIDMENGFNASHEDLPTTFIQLNNTAATTDHGTAVMSILGAKRNGFGVTGIAYGASLGFYGWGSNTPNSIRAAADNLNSGDVLILEGQIDPNITSSDQCSSTSQAECVPMEWLQANYDAIKYATNKGIFVVQAAGNGNENLDDAKYQSRFNRNVRNSGAFLVAATVPAIPSMRESYSNYGTRVDFNAWGSSVASAGYGGLQNLSNATYTQYFSGTSSATPIVAGAIAAIQGYVKANLNRTLSITEVLNLVTQTGLAEPQGVEVGVRPNIKGAILQLANSSYLSPVTLSTRWDTCYGSNTLTWNSNLAATFYSIYLNNAFLKNTSATATNVSVAGSGATAYVKACNAGGCSAESNVVSLIYRNTCL